MFSIFFAKKPVNIEDECVFPTSIVIGSFSEMMNIPLSYWNISGYQDSRISSLKEGLEYKKHASLAVSMYEPESTNFLITWVLFFLAMIFFKTVFYFWMNIRGLLLKL